MRNIVTRTIAGTVYVSLIVCSLIFHPVALGIITVLINHFALLELNKIGARLKLQAANYWVIANTFFMIIAIVLLNLGFSAAYVFLPVMAIPVAVFVSTVFLKIKNPVLHLSFVLFCAVYVSLPLLLLNLIQQASIRVKIPFVLALFIIIWTNDTFAYLSGISFGKHKILKRISPLKSWEGFIGGLIMVIPVLLIFYHFFPFFGIANWFIFGFLTTIFAVAGDFLESLIKRTADIKDSGKILPGHGGILDRIDSLLIAIPVIFIYLQFVIKP